MRQKMLYLFIAGLILFISCDDNEKSSDTNLSDTKWKLIGIVDTKTNKLEVLEPKACTECYTVTFDTDSTIIAHSINKLLKLNLLHLNPSEINMRDMLFCEKYLKNGEDYCDSQTFRTSVMLTESYTVTHNELRLFVFNSDSYLLFSK